MPGPYGCVIGNDWSLEIKTGKESMALQRITSPANGNTIVHQETKWVETAQPYCIVPGGKQGFCVTLETET